MDKIVVKLLSNGAIVVALLMLFSAATFWGAVIAAVVLSILAYVLGDLIILRASNNSIATFADFGLTFIYLWLVSIVWDWGLNLGESFMISLAISIFEIWFHKYISDERQPA